jgi:predicted DNA-binding ribbon-helix-helix protein
MQLHTPYCHWNPAVLHPTGTQKHNNCAGKLVRTMTVTLKHCFWQELVNLIDRVAIPMLTLIDSIDAHAPESC